MGLTDKAILAALLAATKKAPRDTVIGYVPNAREVKKERSRIADRMAGLEKLGFSVVKIDLENFKGRKLEQRLNGVDVIYVGGGNSFRLLSTMRKSGFAKLVPKLLDHGKLYIGSSAGSYVTCPTIEQAIWKHKNSDINVVGLKDLTGLNLVPFLVTAHFIEKYRSIIKAEEKQTKYPIVALRNTPAILVSGKKYKVIGRGARAFFNGFSEKS